MFELGSSLREARVRRNLNLVEVEQATKIRSKYISALEGEDFDVLPGAVYTRGFLRTYALYLGLDGQLYIDEYNSRFGRFEEIDDPQATWRGGEDARRMPGLRTLSIVSLLLLAVLAWAGLRAPAGGDIGRRELPRVVADAATAGTTFHGRHEQLVAERVRPQAPQRARLVVRAAKGSSWIEVRRSSASGSVLYVGTIQAGTSRTFTARRLWVNVGYPAATVLRVGGRRVAPTSASAQAFVVTPRGVRAAA